MGRAVLCLRQPDFLRLDVGGASVRAPSMCAGLSWDPAVDLYDAGYGGAALGICLSVLHLVSSSICKRLQPGLELLRGGVGFLLLSEHMASECEQAPQTCMKAGPAVTLTAAGLCGHVRCAGAERQARGIAPTDAGGCWEGCPSSPG